MDAFGWLASILFSARSSVRAFSTYCFICSHRHKTAIVLTLKYTSVSRLHHCVSSVTLRRAQLVLGWVTVCEYTISVFNQRPTQPGHPSMGWHNEYWRWSWPALGKKRRVLHNSRPCYQDCWCTGLVG